MCGCCSRAASRISLSNRSALTPAIISGGRTFTTTSRPSSCSWARKTRDIPPPPSSRVIVYDVPSVSCSELRSDMRLSPRVGHLRLQLRVGVLPQVDERAVVRERLVALTFHLVQLPEALVHCGKEGRVDARALELRRAEEPFENGDRRIGFAIQIVRTREHRGVADRASHLIRGAQLGLGFAVLLGVEGDVPSHL